MKAPTLPILGGLSLALVSCGSFQSMNQPLSGTSGFDPLGSPGAGAQTPAIVAPTGPSYQPGQWVETSMDNATFFLTIPQGNARAHKVLAAGTPMKVVSSSGTYIKVELDSGEVGFVPSIMIAERRSPSEIPVTPGAVPPPVEPGIVPEGGVAPPPEIPGTPPPVPSVPPVVPAVPAGPGPDVAPPPEIPGITDPTKID